LPVASWAGESSIGLAGVMNFCSNASA